MRRYHHIGLPTTKPRPGEHYLPDHKIYHSGYETSPYGIEWMRYAKGCALPKLVRTVAHIAFEVDDLEKEMAGKKVLIRPNSPSEGVVVAFIEEDGVPVELLCYATKARAGKRPSRRTKTKKPTRRARP
jgi:hypothetical protein